MSSGLLLTGQVSATFQPTEPNHVIRLQDIQFLNRVEDIIFSEEDNETFVSLVENYISCQIHVQLAEHTAPYVAKLSILANNTNYRGPIFLLVTSEDDNPTLEIYDDEDNLNLIETLTFAGPERTFIVFFTPDGIELINTTS